VGYGWENQGYNVQGWNETAARSRQAARSADMGKELQEIRFKQPDGLLAVIDGEAAHLAVSQWKVIHTLLLSSPL